MNFKAKEPILFILSGKARSGKDTVAKYIKKYFDEKNIKSIRLAYAESIKNYAKNIVDWDGKDETKPRDLLQQLGTEIIRNQIDSNFFVKRMIEDIRIYSYFFDVMIISDARFVDEIEEPKKYFDKVIVIKVEKTNSASELTEQQLEHRSETALDQFDDYDYIIENNNTLEALEQKVYNILNEVK